MHAQVITEGMGAAYLRLKLKDQASALGMLGEDAALAGLRQLRAPLLDLEVRGLPALQYFGGMVWRDAIDNYSAGEERERLLSSIVLWMAAALGREGRSLLLTNTAPACSARKSAGECSGAGLAS